MKKRLILILFILSLSACSTAGPYVTNISSDGANGLNIERCKVEFNHFIGYISTGDCSTSTLKLTTPTPVQAPIR